MGEKPPKLRWCIARSVGISPRMRHGPTFVSSVTALLILALLASVNAQTTTWNHPRRNPSRYNSTSENFTIPAPQNVSATLIANESKASITWDPVNLDGVHVDKFLVKVTCHERAVKCCGSCQPNNETEVNSTEIAFGVDRATRYDIQVAAISKNGVGNYSSTISIETKATVPRRPEIEPKTTNASVTLNWNYTCPYTGPVDYLVEIGGKQRGVLKLESGDSCMYSSTAGDLQPFTNISYSLLAVNPSCQAECAGISNQREQTTTFRGFIFDETSVPSDEAEDASDSTDDFESRTPSISSEVATSRSFTTTDYEVTSEGTFSPLMNEDLPCHVCITDSVKTLPNVAGKPQLTIKWPDFKTDTKTDINFDVPQNSSVPVESYNISVTVENKTEYCNTSGGRSEDCIICPICSSSEKHAYIDKTKINTTYRIEVRAKNSGTSEYGPPAVKSNTTGIGWPVIVKFKPYEYLSSTELQNYALYKVFPIKVLSKAFDDSHGPITSFQILLSGDGCPKIDENRFFTKPDDLDLSKTFQGTVRYQDSSVPEDFEFDSLESSTTYTFKFRIYSFEKFTDSDCYSFTTHNNYVRENAINISLVVIVMLFATCIALIIYRRRFSPFVKSGDAMELPLLLTPVVDASLSRPIPLSNVSDAVQRLMADGQTELKREHQDLEIASPSKLATVANNMLNVSKNRYINILPFDETRVILNEYRGIPQSDYYNASYIHGYEKTKEFIACQGPREHEKDTFWRMIWEKNVHVVVMVTKCVESRTEKCSKYWPDASGNDLILSMSELRVRTLEEIPHTEEGYIRRTIKLSKKQSLIPIPKSRIIQQFHYILWPDMGCPKDPDHLIHFTNVVKKAIPPKTCTVVHCSAGVGRTGTFIALCNLQEEMKVKNTVDVFQAVYRMRQNRKNMVQTLAQYGFIYKCVQRWEEMHQGNCKLDQVLIHDNIPDVITTTFSALNASDTKDDPYQQEEPSRNSELILDDYNKSATLIELESMTDEECQEQDFTKIPEDDATSKQGDVTTNGDGEATKDYVTTKGDGEATKDYETTKGDGATTKDSDLTAKNGCQGDGLKQES